MAILKGPIGGGRHGWPYGAATADLDSVGYVEEEYFVDGVAPRYRPTGELEIDGRWEVEESDRSPFATRVVIRRPTDPSRFNGTLVVEWNNVSAGSDIFEGGDTPGFFEEGFAYAGVSAQRVGIHGFASHPQGLQAWDPERYQGLHITDDSLSYGVFAEVAKAVLGAGEGDDPLGGLVVSNKVAIGGSQSAGRLVTYINAMHSRDRIFDAFIPFTWFGSGASVDSAEVFDPSDLEALARITIHPTRIRDDLDAKVIVVNSECETLACAPIRQPDTERFRFWEVAGAPHAPRLHMERILLKMERDGVAAPGGGAFDPAALSPIPWAPVLDAALGHVHGWVQGGSPPPHQPLIELDTDPVRIRRDADGNAVGGIRLPEMAATLWICVGSREESGQAGLMGVWSPLPSVVVKERYGDQKGYLAAFAEAASAAVAAGVLRPADAEASLARASRYQLP